MGNVSLSEDHRDRNLIMVSILMLSGPKNPNVTNYLVSAILFSNMADILGSN